LVLGDLLAAVKLAYQPTRHLDADMTPAAETTLPVADETDPPSTKRPDPIQ